jgi:lysine-specific demethylase 8
VFVDQTKILFKSFSSVYCGICYLALSDYQNCLRFCDLSLLMGCPEFSASCLQINSLISYAYENICEKNSAVENCLFLGKNSLEKNSTNIQQLSREILPSKSLCNFSSIERISCPSLSFFYNEILNKKKPIILLDCIDHWPALSFRRWSLAYLKAIAGHRTGFCTHRIHSLHSFLLSSLVPIEVGNKYTDDNWTQKFVTISEFIANFIETSDGKIGYLAQHALFDQIPELKKDIEVR